MVRVLIKYFLIANELSFIFLIENIIQLLR